jgi:uncharacterized membrane protein YozB (DUF420 family)
MEIESLPTLNALLNGTSATLLMAGWILIKKRRINGHIACMVSALCTSALFLGCYLFYHYHHGSTKFTGEGWSRPLYFSILFSHVVLAVTMVPMIAVTVFHAVRKQYERHLRIARWTLPIWLYVSITGVVIYVMLYHIFAGA